MSAFERLLEQKAVALQYSPEKDSAPVIVASGMGYMAEKITEAARKSGVPVYEDDSLATLLSRLQLGAAVPEELYQAIIEIYIYFLGYVPSPEKKKMKKKSKIPDRRFRHGRKCFCSSFQEFCCSNGER